VADLQACGQSFDLRLGKHCVSQQQQGDETKHRASMSGAMYDSIQRDSLST
jgi:hypothetical protein